MHQLAMTSGHDEALVLLLHFGPLGIIQLDGAIYGGRPLHDGVPRRRLDVSIQNHVADVLQIQFHEHTTVIDQFGTDPVVATAPTATVEPLGTGT